MRVEANERLVPTAVAEVSHGGDLAAIDRLEGRRSPAPHALEQVRLRAGRT